MGTGKPSSIILLEYRYIFFNWVFVYYHLWEKESKWTFDIVICLRYKETTWLIYHYYYYYYHDDYYRTCALLHFLLQWRRHWSLTLAARSLPVSLRPIFFTIRTFKWPSSSFFSLLKRSSSNKNINLCGTAIVRFIKSVLILLTWIKKVFSLKKKMSLFRGGRPIVTTLLTNNSLKRTLATSAKVSWIIYFYFTFIVFFIKCLFLYSNPIRLFFFSRSFRVICIYLFCLLFF